MYAAYVYQYSLARPFAGPSACLRGLQRAARNKQGDPQKVGWTVRLPQSGQLWTDRRGLERCSYSEQQERMEVERLSEMGCYRAE